MYDSGGYAGERRKKPNPGVDTELGRSSHGARLATARRSQKPKATGPPVYKVGSAHSSLMKSL